MSVQDSYVSRRSKEAAFTSTGENALVKALAAKAHAVRRLERQGRRTKVAARSMKNSYAA